MNKDYRTVRNYDYITEYRFAGYGLNTAPIYAKYETKFNIAKGVVYSNKFIGYCDENKNEYNSYIR